MHVQPDWEIDAFTKAQIRTGKRHSIVTDLILKLLGLDVSLAPSKSCPDSAQSAICFPCIQFRWSKPAQGMHVLAARHFFYRFCHLYDLIYSACECKRGASISAFHAATHSKSAC